MVRELIIHIGDHKTGSTAIQRSLAGQLWESDGPEILYTSKNKHNGLASALLNQGTEEERNKRFSAQARKLVQSDAEIAVFSAEGFEWVNPVALAAVLQRHFPDLVKTVRVIAYVRPRADRLVSGYAERVKQGLFSGTLAEFHAKTKATGIFQYYPRFRTWQKTFGARLELRPMVRSALFQNCVVHDFLNYALRGTPFRLTQEIETNISLCVEDLALLRALQRILAPAEAAPSRAQIAVGVHFARLLGQKSLPQGGTKLCLHQSLMQDVLAIYQEDAARMDCEFFSGAPLQEALSETAKTPLRHAQSLDLEDCFSAGEFRRISASISMLATLCQNHTDTLPAHLREVFRPPGQDPSGR